MGDVVPVRYFLLVLPFCWLLLEPERHSFGENADFPVLHAEGLDAVAESDYIVSELHDFGRLLLENHLEEAVLGVDAHIGCLADVRKLAVLLFSVHQ